MDQDQIRQRLESERNRLEEIRAAAARLQTGADEGVMQELSSVDQHPAEQASETLEREIDASVLQRTESELVEVQDALRRLDDGRYGVCETCGQPIADARLEAMPATRYCVEDAAKAGRGPRPRQ